ncbi:hypothetical protein FGADI_2752 [Fusarium gaditjirri]|uniref:Uncharacterized protein n=1 Tax=Fusarium gaditjirri TaxID=282569 RepID=A0A8H4THE5_9HYPO|nr:hypothetical protein FGADI_2752 [Fusarium gaditjirri]
MAHEYLCVGENGSLYWPSTSDDGSLRYSRDNYESAANNGRRPRNLLSVLGSESPTPSPPDQESPNYSAAAYDDGDSSSSSESPQSSQPPRQDEVMNDRRPVPYGRTYSPDELAGNGIDEPLHPLPDPHPRRVSRMQDAQDNLRHMGPDPRPNIGVGHRERGNNPPAHAISTGTQTGFETDEYRDRDPNAPPPSSMNSNNASQQSQPQQANHDGNQPRSMGARESIEYGQRSPSPPSGVPRSPSSEPKPNIDLIFSYDVLPGLNFRMAHGEEIFSFHREQVFQLLGWQHDFDWLLISLETPGALFPERIPRDDNREFRKVMARFEQIVDALKRDYAEVERGAVIEIAFVPLCKGHSRTVMMEAWVKRMTESRGVVFRWI